MTSLISNNWPLVMKLIAKVSICGQLTSLFPRKISSAFIENVIQNLVKYLLVYC